MLSSKDVEKLNDLCVKFEKEIIEYVKNLYVEKGFVKDEIKVTVDYSPQYKYEQKELTAFQKILKFLGFAVVDVGLYNCQVLRLYTLVVSPSDNVPYIIFQPGLSGQFFLDDTIPFDTCFAWYTDKLKEKLD